MRIEIILCVLTMLGFISCKRGNQKQAASPQTVMTNLVSECKMLVEEGTKQGKEIWMSGDALPPTIKSLSPQYVQLITSQTATVVDIQTSGGFKHRGYLVICSSKDPAFIPEKGRNWRIQKVATDVFEYEE